MRIGNQGFIAVSTAIPWTSQALFVGSTIECAIQLTFTSTSAVFKLQCSVDEGKNIQEGWIGTNVAHWTDILDSTVNITEAGDLTYDISDISYRWLRVVATGTGTVDSARSQTKGA